MEDLKEFKDKINMELHKIDTLGYSVERTTLSVIAMMAPLVTMEMRRIANSLESILEAIYSNQNK